MAKTHLFVRHPLENTLIFFAHPNDGRNSKITR